MVNKVDNRSSVTAAYESAARKRKRSETDAPAFLLGDDDGVVWDRSDKKEKEKVRKEEKVEEQKPAPKQEAVKEEKSFNFRDIISMIRDRIRAIYNSALRVLWYGEDDKKDDRKEEKMKEEQMSDEEKEQMKLLHNTSILTCYDKKGKLTKMEGLPGKKTYRQHI